MPEDLTLLSLSERLHCVESSNTRLERQNRWLKSVALLALSALLAVVCMGQMAKPRTIEAEQFILRDAAGAKRAELGSDYGTTLRIYDPKGKELATFGERGMSLHSSENRAVANLRIGEQGPVLSLHDVKGVGKGELAVDNTGAHLSVDGITEAGGGAKASLYAYKDDGYLIVHDRDGHGRVVVGLFDDQPSAKLMDVEGRRALWSAP
jgi:hypothetical protein